MTIFFTAPPLFFWPNFETSNEHKIITRGRKRMIGTVLESSRRILFENNNFIIKLHVFDAFLEPKRYTAQILANFWPKLMNTVRVTKLPKFQKFSWSWKMWTLGFPIMVNLLFYKNLEICIKVATEVQVVHSVRDNVKWTAQR